MSLRMDITMMKITEIATVSLMIPVHQNATEGINKHASATYPVFVKRILFMYRKKRQDMKLDMTEKNKLSVR